jgi:excisionase family DNA binding protein
MTVNNNTESLISLEELSRRVSLHRNTVARLVDQNVLAGYKIGGQWRFDYEEVKRDLKNQNPRERLKR